MPIADGTDLKGADSCGIIITISRVTPDTADDFVRCSAKGFAITGRARILLETLLRSRLSDARRAGFDGLRGGKLDDTRHAENSAGTAGPQRSYPEQGPVSRALTHIARSKDS